jgi:hypothetical protein
VAGGSDAVSRRGDRRGGPHLEIDDELGAAPRPTSPNEKVSTYGAPLLRFSKPKCGDGAASTSGVLASAAPSLGVRRGGAGVRWRIGSSAESPEDFFVFFIFWGFFLQSVQAYVSFWTVPCMCVRIVYPSLI